MSWDRLPSANPRYPGQPFLSCFLPLTWNTIPQKKRATCPCMPINKIFQHLKLCCGNEHTHSLHTHVCCQQWAWSSVSMRENPPGKPSSLALSWDSSSSTHHLLALWLSGAHPETHPRWTGRRKGHDPPRLHWGPATTPNITPSLLLLLPWQWEKCQKQNVLCRSPKNSCWFSNCKLKSLYTSALWSASWSFEMLRISPRSWSLTTCRVFLLIYKKCLDYCFVFKIEGRLDSSLEIFFQPKQILWNYFYSKVWD